MRAPFAADTKQQLLRAGIVVVATLFYLSRPTKDDISWLLVVADALLDGKRLYVDIIETNPPMSVLLYIPAVALERLLHIRAETLVIFQTLIVCLLCSEMATRLAAKARLAAAPETFRTAAIVATVLLPMGAFGQKDHLAFAVSLPLLIVIAGPDRRLFLHRDQLAAGLLGGLAMIIKPQFALAFALPGLAMAIQRRRLSDLYAPAILVAAASVVLYTLALYLFCPRFLSQMLPMLADLYRPLRMSRLRLFMPHRLGGYSLLFLAVSAWPLRRQAFRPLPLVLLLAGVGFFLAFIEQAKGWPYHFYPAVASGTLLGIGVTLPAFREELDHSHQAFLAWVGCLAMVFLWTVRVLFWTWIDYSALTDAVRSLGLEQPRILAIAASHGTGHPVTRDAGGKWVGTLASRWMTVSALTQKNLGFPEGRTRSFDDWISLDRAYLRQDILERQPDVILIQRSDNFDWLAWAREDPAVATAISQYDLTGSVADPEEPGFVEIWRRAPKGS